MKRIKIKDVNAKNFDVMHRWYIVKLEEGESALYPIHKVFQRRLNHARIDFMTDVAIHALTAEQLDEKIERNMIETLVEMDILKKVNMPMGPCEYARGTNYDKIETFGEVIKR